VRTVAGRQSPVVRKKRKRVAQEIWDYVNKDKFAQSLGIELLELREGYAKCAMVVKKSMSNFHGSTHGGAITTLADAAFAAACNSYGQRTVALAVTINFIEAVKPATRLIATAEEEAASARIGLYHLVVMDEGGKVVASSHATAYRKNEWFHKRSNVETLKRG
jgi:acyl-CoA thioesterase